MRKHSRRSFLKLTAAGIAGVTLLPNCGGAPKESVWRFFNDDDADTIIALCEQIIPADEDPGATHAGVIYFIDKQLTKYYKDKREAYTIGLQGLRETCEVMYGRRFVDLTWDEQYEICLTLESGEAPGPAWEHHSSASFFSMVVDHTMQGFYGSPEHGGNRDYMSYKMLQLDFPYIIGQNRYKESGGR